MNECNDYVKDKFLSIVCFITLKKSKRILLKFMVKNLVNLDQLRQKKTLTEGQAYSCVFFRILNSDAFVKLFLLSHCFVELFFFSKTNKLLPL